MTDKGSEILRYSLYIIVGLLAGLSIGIGVGPQFRDFVINNGWPNESISLVTMSLIFISIMLNSFLYHGLKKGDYRKSVTKPSTQSKNS
jgi:hypothetical protein